MIPFDPSPREDDREERARLIRETSDAQANKVQAEAERVAALVARFRAEFTLDIERATTLSDLRDVTEGWLVLLRGVPREPREREGG